MKVQFKRFFSVDSPKAIKADKYGYLNAINYMAPHTSGGVGNLCASASPGCIDLCLGEHSGQAAMVSRETGTSAVRESRKRKAQFFASDVQGYMDECCHHIERLVIRAAKMGRKLCVRMNGATDIPYERIKIRSRGNRNIFDVFPHVQFVDYTKRFERLGNVPANLHLTFSRSETNERWCDLALDRGHNVAVVFAGDFPATWHGAQVIDGDAHDLRHLDPKGSPIARGGHVVGLSPKGNRAKRDASGFVVRDAVDLAIAA